ncbi:hypothetical protein SNE40_016822 [Patella caerulea]|uniref:Alpha galactosidase C-terminal domain-containing protein n=1 Tax=Patella caerulea TaxID=87958 RepID=A0AAN8PEM1_PATCE
MLQMRNVPNNKWITNTKSCVNTIVVGMGVCVYVCSETGYYHQQRLGFSFQLAQNKIYVFLKELTGDRTAVALFNSDYHGQPVRATFMLNQLGLTNGNDYSFTDGFTGMARGKYMPASEINIEVKPTGIDIFIATPV